MIFRFPPSVPDCPIYENVVLEKEISRRCDLVWPIRWLRSWEFEIKSLTYQMPRTDLCSLLTPTPAPA